jgi:hypothetical protein
MPAPAVIKFSSPGRIRAWTSAPSRCSASPLNNQLTVCSPVCGWGGGVHGGQAAQIVRAVVVGEAPRVDQRPVPLGKCAPDPDSPRPAQRTSRGCSTSMPAVRRAVQVISADAASRLLIVGPSSGAGQGADSYDSTCGTARDVGTVCGLLGRWRRWRRRRSAIMAIRSAGSGTRSCTDKAALAARARSGAPRPNIRFSGPPDGSISTCSGGAAPVCPSPCDMTIRWISVVPSKIMCDLASRYHFSTG